MASPVTRMIATVEATITITVAFPAQLGTVPNGLRPPTETRFGRSLGARLAGLVANGGTFVVAARQRPLAGFTALPRLC